MLRGAVPERQALRIRTAGSYMGGDVFLGHVFYLSSMKIAIKD